MYARVYLSQTEYAAMHMFDAVESYVDRWKLVPSFHQFQSENGEIKMTPEEAQELTTKYRKIAKDQFSIGLICGSILQIAYMGLILADKKRKVSDACKEIGVSDNDDISRFCVGREIVGLPLGLTIYAARIQYNHWIDGWSLNPIPRQVFERIYAKHRDNVYFDLAYELDYPYESPKSEYILLNEFKWESYQTFRKDMNEMLSS